MDAFCEQLSLVLRKHVSQNCTELLREQYFLSCLAFTRRSPPVRLVSRVGNKPNTQLSSDVNDFVNAKSHACKRETSARRLVQR